MRARGRCAYEINKSGKSGKSGKPKQSKAKQSKAEAAGNVPCKATGAGAGFLACGAVGQSPTVFVAATKQD